MISQNFKFYKIISHIGNKIYIGKTKKQLNIRFSEHKSHYRLYQNGDSNYTSSFELFDEYTVDNCSIELITEVLCNKMHACIIEGNYQRLYIENPLFECVNHNFAGRTRQEYRLTNIDKINCKYQCACHGKYTYQGHGQHLKTRKHIEFIKNLLII